jgi:hypothetical protein
MKLVRLIKVCLNETYGKVKLEGRGFDTLWGDFFKYT